MTDVDIRTGCPKTLRSVRGGGDQPKQMQARRYAEFMSVSESDAKKNLQALIETKLMEKINELLGNDAYCKACIDMLRTITEREDLARWAVQKLVQKDVAP